MSPQQELEFGLFDWIDAAPGRAVGEVYEDRLALLAEADRDGFTVYHLAEHHGTPLGLAPSPAVYLAAAARETTRIRLAPTTFIVPLYEPLRLVEEIGMLDQLSGGRLEIGVGKGSSPHEAAMFGLTAPQTAERFEELMPAVLEALETGVFRRPGGVGGGRPGGGGSRASPAAGVGRGAPPRAPCRAPGAPPRRCGTRRPTRPRSRGWATRATTCSSASGSSRRRWMSSGSRASSSS